MNSTPSETRANEHDAQTAAVTVCREDDLLPGEHMVVDIGGREVGVFNVNGRLYGLLSRCPHQQGPLCRGKVSGTLGADAESGWRTTWIHEGEVVTCPWHGLEFHIPTGQCLAYPRTRVRTFDVVVDDGWIKVRP